MASRKRRGLSGMQAAVVVALAIGGLIFMPRRCTHDLDEEFFPYALTGIRPEFFFPSGKTAVLGEIATTYDTRASALTACQQSAGYYAELNHVEAGWTYVCCTVTPESSCKSKVK